MNLRYTWLTTKGAFVLALIQQNILSNPHWLKLIQSHVETSRKTKQNHELIAHPHKLTRATSERFSPTHVTSSGSHWPNQP